MNQFLHQHGTKMLLMSAIACWWLGGAKGTALPDAERIDRRIHQSPVQVETSKKPFNVEWDGRPYRVQPRFSYDIHGLVVSEHHSDGLFDMYHRMTGDFFNVCDLAMVWGVNAKSGIYKKGKFHNQDFTAWVQYDDPVDWSTFRLNEFSNNHLISEISTVRRQLKGIRIGDQVRIKGWLAEYYSPPSYHRGTSTTRDDTGGYACETIYVTDVERIQSGNTRWRMLQTIGKVITLTLVFIQLATWFGKWRQWKRLTAQ